VSTPDKERTVRELGGEIWAELSYSFSEDDINWEMRNAVVDLVMAVLARHIGVSLVNDGELPVTPLPRSQNES
jgi:hypothetical protein